MANQWDCKYNSWSKIVQLETNGEASDLVSGHAYGAWAVAGGGWVSGSFWLPQDDGNQYSIPIPDV